jgi:GNAT superfamily N-acetyltransferase
MAVRQATASDLEDLSNILLASSNDDPCYPYRFPLKDQYPLQYEEHCKRKCWEYLRTDTVIVYEVTNPPNSRREKKVIAFSVWEQPKARRPKAKRSQTWPRWHILPSSNKAADSKEAHQPAHGQRQRPSITAPHPNQLTRIPSQPKPFAREDRSQAFREASQIAKANFLDTQYTGGYMFLKILLCHPSYRRRGAGTALVKWGMSVAHVQGVNTALFSSPMGVPLYHRLGFQQIGTFEVKVDGDEEKLGIPAMVFRAPSPPQSRRGSRCAAEVTPNGLRKCVTNSAMVV